MPYHWALGERESMIVTDANRRWWVLVAMTGSNSMVFLDQTVVSVALTAMQHDLSLSESQMHWVVNAYVLAVACLIALGGRLGDVFGKPRVFMLGVSVFVVGSLLCGLAPSAHALGPSWLIGSRALQGAGAALMLPASSAIAVNAFPLEERGRAMAIYSGIGQTFLAVGPALGGLLTQYASWRWVFLLNVPIGIIAIGLTLFSQPKEPPREREPIDMLGAGLLILGLGAFVWGLEQSVAWTFASPATWAFIGGGVLCLGVFVTVERRLKTPLVDFRLFKVRAFLANNLLLFAMQAGLLATIIFGALYFQTALMLDPVAAGLALLPLILGTVFVSRFAGAILDKYGARIPVTIGLLLSFVGMLLWTLALPKLQFVWQAPGMMLTGFGLGLVMVPTMTDSLNRVPPEIRGQASGLVQTTRQMGASVGIAVVGTLFIGTESRMLGRLKASPEGKALGEEHLDRLVVGYRHADPEVIAELHNYPAVSLALKEITAEATQAGFWFPVVALGVAFVIAVTLMERGKQSQEITALDAPDC